MAILCRRADEFVLEQLKHSNRLHSYAEQVIAENLNLQSSMTELTALVLHATEPLQKALHDACDGEQVLDAKLASMRQRMEAGSSKCLVGC